MSLQPNPTDSESTARLFRSRVFKPAEGVFLFHPRAMERLIAEHLEPRGDAVSIPNLAYYLMPCPAFLTGLESENPEALAVIEGLNLPDQAILLPLPLEPQLDHAGFTRLLRDYWARRFEGEIARAWQMARDDNQDSDRFGPDALRALIGDPAFTEVRDLLTRDDILPAGLDDARICRGFVAFISRLRYFSPGARGFFLPAIRDWAGLDRWLAESGLDLPPPGPGPGGRLPRLLECTRPDQRCGHPALKLPLPSDLPYGCSDPDFTPSLAAPPTHDPAREALSARDIALPAPSIASAANAIEARCLEALRLGLQLPRQHWRLRLRDAALSLCAPLLDALLALPNQMGPRRSPPAPASGIRLALSLTRFSHAVRMAQRAELTDRHGEAIAQLAAAQRRFQAMGEPCAPEATRIREVLTQRALGAEEALSDLLAATWKLRPERAAELSALMRRLGDSILDAPEAKAARSLLRDLERVLLESRATYYHLRPIHWLLGGGKARLRQILPFQASLKALRALDAGLNHLDRLGWPSEEIERFGKPLQALSKRVTDHLETQLKPRLKRALQESDFTPSSHREEVAANKLLRELLDVIQHRRHLKFTDARDIVARNLLRLPDLTPGELLTGDRLARFDRAAARALPGVYKPGELYIKGLQQLSAPLFGTPPGRLMLRYLMLPLGLAFLGLKTLDVLIGLIAKVDPVFHLANVWMIGAVGLLINLIVHGHALRHGVLALLRGLWSGLRLILFDGPRGFIRWQPVSNLLNTSLARGLDRNLMRPFLIGILALLPFMGLGSLIEGELMRPDISFLALALALGTLIGNTPTGRRLLDDIVSALGRLLSRLNQTLIIGLIQELMQFFKEVNRRFQQGLHRIEELLSHHLGESRLELALKSILIPLWRILESMIQFYVTVLVEPQVNPIKHFPLVTIAHKLMLPFFPAITGFLIGLLDPLLPKWIGYPFITLTVLLLPGLAGFLVWELKENWRLYAANHRALAGKGQRLGASRRADLADVPIEPAIIGTHGETMRGLLRRGFHSGTLPKAFDRLRRVLRHQIRDEVESPRRLREARRHLAEVEQAISVFCDRELAHALRRRCQNPECGLSRIETRRPRLATTSLELTLDLHASASPRLNADLEPEPIEIRLAFRLVEPDLILTIEIGGPAASLSEACWMLIREDLGVFGGRAGARQP